MARTVRAPRPGLETLAYETLCGRGATHYRDLATMLFASGRAVNPVAILDVLTKGRDLFLDLGAGRYFAVSRAHAFSSPTENLWLHLPPYKASSTESVERDVRRIALARYLTLLPDSVVLADLLKAVGNWRSFPNEAQLEDAKGRTEDDALAYRAAVGYIEQLSRVSPQPSLSTPVDVGSIDRSAVAARQRLVENNLRLVADTARGYAGRGVPFFDLCQTGVFGLLVAIKKFDPARGFTFSTYATWWLRQAMRRSLADEGRVIRVPVHMYEKSPWLHKEHAPHAVPADTPATLRPILSLDSIDEERWPAVNDDLLARAENAIQYSALIRTLDQLTERQREVLTRRFGLGGGAPQTLEAIGNHFNLTRERIRQIEAKALKKLRHPSRHLRRLLDAPTTAEPGELRPYRSAHATEWLVICLRYGLDGRPPRSLGRCAAVLQTDSETVLYTERVALSLMVPRLAAMLCQHKWVRPLPNIAFFAATYFPMPKDAGQNAKDVFAKTAQDRPGFPDVERGPGRDDRPLVPRPVESMDNAPAADSTSGVAADGSLDATKDPQTLAEAMKRLTSAESLILTQRLGLDGKRRLSLQDIAYLYRYKDDRVRFLQSAAILKLGPRFGAQVEKQLASDIG